MTVTPDPGANPMAGNPLVTKADLQQAVRDLVEPLVPCLTPGSARVRLSSSGSVFPQRVTELEGYARPLYGIVPLALGGGEFAHWDRWLAGLSHGTDPEHPLYWGPVAKDSDQRMVEMAAIGTALAFVPEHIWDPLPPKARDHVIEWLRGIERFEPFKNNWQFMRLLVAMGLERVGVSVDRDALRRSQNMLETFYLGDGWYTDGSKGNTDYYIPFAFHTYGLMLAASRLGDRSLADAYRERARLFAPQFVHWFAADGAAIPFGRSQTYRMAQGSFWGALVLADEEALPWATVKGMALRHLRWWAQWPISNRGGVLSLGYGYENRRMVESYSSSGSPYWAMKAFLMLAAADGHPFWTAAEDPLAPLVSSVTLTGCGMVIDRDERQTVALVAQAARPGSWVEQDDAKYRKFAYSSVFGFSGDLDIDGRIASDSALALTDLNSGVRRLRANTSLALVEDGVAYVRWEPWDDVRVDTVLAGGLPGHLRIHRLRTARALLTEEGGFALAFEPEGLAPLSLSGGDDPHRAKATTPWGVSAITDLEVSTIPRAGEVRLMAANANVLWPHTVVPMLTAELVPGTHTLGCVVVAADAPGPPDAGVAPELLAAAKTLLERMEPIPTPKVDATTPGILELLSRPIARAAGRVLKVYRFLKKPAR